MAFVGFFPSYAKLWKDLSVIPYTKSAAPEGLTGLKMLKTNEINCVDRESNDVLFLNLIFWFHLPFYP